jgi:glycosyltransferase involved in cell wall biosynthesis
MAAFHGRLGLQQRVLPAYRVAFYNALSEQCPGGLSVIAGQPLAVEEIVTADRLDKANYTLVRNWHFNDPSSSLYLCWQTGLLDWLRSWDPQVLIVEANPRYLSTRLVIGWMHTRHRPVLGWGLGAPTLSGTLAGIRQKERALFLRSLDGMIAYSHKGAKEYCTLGFNPSQVFLAPNAVTFSPINPPPVHSKTFTCQPVILFVGRIQTRKRIDNLLRACTSLPKEIQPRLIVVGDGPARGFFQALALQIYPQAEFVGAKSGAELNAYFTISDLFVLPGTGGLAVQEAMSHGLPVIIAQGDGTQDMLVSPQNGWLVPPDDLDALTQALQEALSDPEKLRRMGAESYRIVVEEVNLEKMISAFMQAVSMVQYQGR